MPSGFGTSDLAALHQVGKKGAPQYVLGSPAQKPVLRPLRQFLHDAAKYGAGLPVSKRELFVDRKKFVDGTAKDESHTNMPSDGRLAA